MHQEEPEVLDIIFNIAALVMHELPPAVPALGFVLCKEFWEKKTFPEINDETVKGFLSGNVILALGALRASYLIKLITKALECGAKSSRSHGMGKTLSEAFEKQQPDFVRVDHLCGNCDLSTLSSAYGLIVSQVIKGSKINFAEVTSTVTAASKDEDAVAKENKTAQPTGDDGNGVSTFVVELKSLLDHGCSECNHAGQNHLVESVDAMFEMRLLLAQAMLSHSRQVVSVWHMVKIVSIV